MAAVRRATSASHSGYCRAEFLPARLALAQNEEIFLTVIATQGADDLGQRGTAAPVAQSGEFFGVALTGQYCGDDRLRADTIDVAENVVDVQIHFGHHLLHELHLLAGLGDQIGPVAHEVSQRNDLASRAEACPQQTDGVQLLKPGRVAHVGLFAGHSFDVPRID